MSERIQCTPGKCAAIISTYLAGNGKGRTSEIHAISRREVCAVLRENGIPSHKTGVNLTRRYSLNEGAFDEPTPERDYWVGFAMADSCVYGNYFRTSLAVKDARHLESLRTFLGAGNPIHILKPATKKHFIDDGYGMREVKSGPGALLSIGSEPLVRSLAGFGVVPAKSHIAKVVGLEWSKDFWRGVIDGDGSLGLYQVQSWEHASLQLVGSRFLMEQFGDFVRSVYPAWGGMPRPRRNIWGVALTSDPALALIDFLYRDCVMALPRKLAAAQTVMANGVERKKIPSGGFVLGCCIKFREKDLLLSKDQQEAVLSQYVAGKSMGRLAAQFSCSRQVIRNTLNRAGVKRRKWKLTDEQHDELLAAHETQPNIAALARDYGLTPSAVHGLLMRRGRQVVDSKKNFTDADEKILVGEYLSGATIGELATKHGVSRTGIRKPLIRQGVTRRSREIPNKEEIMRDYLDGWPSTKLADQYGVSHSGICRFLKGRGVSIRGRGFGARLEGEIIEEYEAGESIPKIAGRRNLHSSYISRMFRRRGVKIRR